MGTSAPRFPVVPVVFTAAPIFAATLAPVPVPNVVCSEVGTILRQYGLTQAASYLAVAPSVAQQLAGGFTFFVPTNQALSTLQIPNGVSVPDFIARVLRSHVIQASRPTSTFSIGQSVINGNNQALDLTTSSFGGPAVNQVCLRGSGNCGKVTVADIRACNGYIHVIDKALT